MPIYKVYLIIFDNMLDKMMHVCVYVGVIKEGVVTFRIVKMIIAESNYLVRYGYIYFVSNYS